MIYIFDVDNTILEVHNSEYQKAVPFPGRIEKVNALHDAGHVIVYWTARGATSGIDWHQYTYKQLRSFGCKFSEFHTKKPHYHVWVDDKAVNAADFFKQ